MDDLKAAELAGAAVLTPGDAEYDDARRVHNGLIDRFPAAIVRCRTPRHVAAAVAAARSAGLEISVRGGGHNVAGRAVCDGGLMIDLALMKDTAVDPGTRTVDAGPGLNWGEFNAATQAHGLAVTGGTISTTGISGLTLGGGLGWLMGKFGLAADNLLQAQVVTADGSVITASEAEHPDLFWALRGGGGNFGVVTSFKYRLHPVGPVITGGFRFFPVDEAAAVFRLFREMTQDIPDDLSLVAALVRTPDESATPVAGIIACHAGEEKQAERDLAALRAFGKNPLIDALIRKPYEDVNSQFDYGFPDGALNYWKSSFMSGLPDETIEAMIDAFLRCPSPMSIMMIEDLHGAATRVPVTATAIPHRRKGFNLLIPSVWTDPGQTERNIAWTRQAYAALSPSLTADRYVNYLDDDEADLVRDPVRDAYGPNYDRLAEVKAAYDPDNVFHRNQNIVPRGAAATWAP
jgi:FAD/FMN-containing dehydrogenase